MVNVGASASSNTLGITFYPFVEAPSFRGIQV